MSTDVVTPIKKNELNNTSRTGLNNSESIYSNNVNNNGSGSVDEINLDVEISGETGEKSAYKTYVVGRYGSGEKFTTLWAISKDSGVSIEEIKKANPSIGADNVIHPGQEIIVPIVNDYVEEKATTDTHKDDKKDSEIEFDATTNNSSIDLSKYSNTSVYGNFELTTGNRTYQDMSLEDTLEVAAVIYAEAAPGIKPDDALAVASVIANRVEYVRADTGAAWGGYQQGMQEVVSASGQFSTYGGSSYNEFLTNYRNGNITERMQMCLDVLEDVKNGVRNNDYQAFRSSGSVSYSDNRVVEGGNRYKVTARA